MALEQYPIGRKAAAYWNTAGVLLLGNDSTDAATWLADASTEVWSDQFDVNYQTSATYADITTRKTAANGFSAQKPILLSGEVTFDVLWNTNDASAQCIQKMIDSTFGMAPMAMAFLDYPVDAAGSATGDVMQGLVGNFFVSFTKTEPIQDVQKASFTAVNAGDLIWHKHTVAS
tara:strand:+ start:306 stop:827 length:522 start_codon:yes stop_codon:yes gene_type:complete